MSKLQSKPTTMEPLGGDAAQALSLVRALRAEGCYPTRVKAGGVELELAVVVDAKHGAANIGATAQPRPSVIEEWGGPAFAKALEGEGADLVDDDEQPAIRGAS